MELVDPSIEAFTRVRVLVVGDVMLDQYWKGEVKRISPEAPVPVIAVGETEERIGGAGNVARNITALGGKCTLLGVIGKDEAGKSIARIAGDSGVNAILETDEEIKTTIKLRVLSRNQQLLRADFENLPGQGVIDRLHAHFRNLVNEHDVVIFSDYGKGSLKYIDTLISIAQSCQKPVYIDPKGNDYNRYGGATMVTPNLQEFESVAGEVSDTENLSAQAAALIEKYDISQILVTLSDKGMMLFGRNSDPIHVSARSQEVYDVSGAGDTVIAVMALAKTTGLSDSEAMELANSAAGVVITKLGTATVNHDELSAAMKEGYPA